MRITDLSVSNFLGVSAVTISPKEPIVFVAGPNGAGKTSLYQAIKLALFDELPRIELKKHADALVRDGAARGGITVSFSTNGGESFPISVALPSRTRSHNPIDGISVLCLEPHLFAHMEPDARAKTILNLSRVSMTKQAIAARLTAHGVLAAVVTELDPLLVLGFEKCAEHARTQAAEHRGAWKQVTGETYGSVKAETWKPADQGGIPDAPASLESAIGAHGDARSALERLESRRAVYDDKAAKRESDRVLAPKVQELRAKVAELKVTADADEERTYPVCPECGAVLEVRNDDPAGPLTLVKHVKPPHATVKPAVKAKARAGLAAAQKELIAAEAAAARLLEPLDPSTRPTDDEILVARDLLAQKTDLLSSVTKAQADYAAAVFAQKTTDKQRDNATAQHRWVQGWEKAQEALSPSGIPSELMKQALEPLRAALDGVCASDSISRWPLPVLGEDGSITAWGRPYALLSESEQYRVDIILAAAIAVQSGIKILAMDRADLLSPAVRAELVDWLFDLTEEGLLEQAWVFATLKAPLAFDPGMPAEAHWIDNGALV